MPKFISKLIIRTLIVVFIICFLYTLSASLNTIVGNYIALDQMQNDDFAFIMKELYFNFARPMCTLGIALVSVYFAGFTTYDIIKFIIKRKKIKK